MEHRDLARERGEGDPRRPVAVAPEHRGAFDALVAEHGVPAVALGTTTPGDSLRVETGAGELVLTASEISTARQRTFRELLAGEIDGWGGTVPGSGWPERSAP